MTKLGAPDHGYEVNRKAFERLTHTERLSFYQIAQRKYARRWPLMSPEGKDAAAFAEYVKRAHR